MTVRQTQQHVEHHLTAILFRTQSKTLFYCIGNSPMRCDNIYTCNWGKFVGICAIDRAAQKMDPSFVQTSMDLAFMIQIITLLKC